MTQEEIKKHLEKVKKMSEEVQQAYQEYMDKYNIYKDKYISWLKESKGTIFKLKELPSFHTNNPFEGDGLTICFGGYCKVSDEKHGNPIVRFMHMDIIARNNVFYTEEKMLNMTRYYVNVHNFTGYCYSDLMNIIDRPVNESELIPFVKDIMDDDYELTGYMVDSEDIKNNTPPWWRKHSRNEKII